jgi:single-stranded-DNA-specific exonuclease
MATLARTAPAVEGSTDTPCFPKRRWDAASPDPDAAGELARHLKLSLPAAIVLLNRGFTPDHLDAARDYLRPQLNHLLDPATLPGCVDAAGRLAQAVRDDETIAIYGDYDVDGITASAILWHALVTLGHPAKRIITYVPHRIDEGYGLNAAAIDELADAGATVVVTVDCGITAVEEATRAATRGVDLILTDHHEWRRDDAGEPDLPIHAAGLVHPRLPSHGKPYGNEHLCGAGVAFKLAWQLGREVTGKSKPGGAMRTFLIDAMALAALGTVADVAPLVGENRVIAKFGLGGLTHSRIDGLHALIESAGLDPDKVDSTDVGFKLAPRLNACGRMGHAKEAVEMLTVAMPGKARDIAGYLEKQNRQRQTVEKNVTKLAIELVRDHDWDAPDRSAIVVAGEGWHPGVVGIVASRLVEEFGRPAIVLSLDGETASGSGRGMEGFHLAHLLAGCDDLLETHGGHAMAAGLRCKSANLDVFRERFCELAGQANPSTDRRRILKADAEIPVGQITRSLAEELARLGPFGAGNPRPVFVLNQLRLLAARAVGKTGDHLQLQVDDGTGKPLKGIAFGCGELALSLRPNDTLHVAATPSLNEWNGRVSVELEVKDLAFETGR